jgi:hypothetical protein
LRLDTIDERFRTSEDGPALLEIFRRYRPVAEEGGFVLLERQSPTAGTRTIAWKGSVRFGEAVRLDDLAGDAHVVTMRLAETLRGKLTRLLFRPPSLFLRVRTDDGQELRYRLVPALASAGFLVDPLLRDNDDVLRYYRGETVPRVVSFAVEGAAGAAECYGETIAVVVASVADAKP